MITEKRFENLKKGDIILIKDKYTKAKLIVEVLETNCEFALIKDGEFQYFIPMNRIIKILHREDKPEIHIHCGGNEVCAIEKKDGEVIGTSIAKCSPKDEFDFDKYARIAFERLPSQIIKKSIFVLDENPTNEEISIKNGTRVKIKNMDVFKEVNEINPDAKFVCLDEYIGKTGTVCNKDNTRNDFLIIFDDEYMNAIDKRNGSLYFSESNIEILSDEF